MYFYLIQISSIYTVKLLRGSVCNSNNLTSEISLHIYDTKKINILKDKRANKFTHS